MINFKEVTNVLAAHYGASYYYSDAIPEKKLLNARIYMEVPNDEIILGLCDFTIFGSAKEGAVFTNRGIYGRYLSEKDSITYEELGKCTVTVNAQNEAVVNGKKVCYGKDLGNTSDLILKLNKALRPVDLSGAQKLIKEDKYNKALEALSEQEKYVLNSQKEDVIEFRKLYISANIGLKNITEAEKLLKIFKKDYGTESSVLPFINETEDIIKEFFDIYNRDANKVKEAIQKSKDLAQKEMFEEALKEINNAKLRDDFDSVLLSDYFKAKISAEIDAQKIEEAEASINIAFKQKYISSDQKKLYIAKITSLKNALHEKLLQEHREKLKDTFEACKKLEKEGKIHEAIKALKDFDIRELPKEIVKEYSLFLFELLLHSEDVDAAKDYLIELHKNGIINESEEDECAEKIEKLENELHEKLLDKQRETLKKAIETAKMFEDHGILESASDTINAAISDAPEELESERVEAFKLLIELLVSQYEYDQVYELKAFYKNISSDSLLGFDLKDLLKKHKEAHYDEYHAHLYEKAVYYMHFGNYEEARKQIQKAKDVKITLDIRCAEIALAILEMDYKECRILLDSLIRDKDRFAKDDVNESIEHFEAEYFALTDAISSTLKVCAIKNDFAEIIENSKYDDFCDNNGLNPMSIAARFTNYDMAYKISQQNKDNTFSSSFEGFDFPFFAAMQLDFDAFEKFMNRDFNRYNGKTDYIINNDLSIRYETPIRIEEIRQKQNTDKSAATKIAFKELFDTNVMLFAGLLNEECFEKVCSNLQKKKAKLTKAVEKLENELPALLERIDSEYNKNCDLLIEVVENFEDLILDVPSSRKEKAKSALSVLKETADSTIEFARKNAQIAKDEKEWEVKSGLEYLEEIQDIIDSWKSINKEEIKELFKIPASAICFGEYNESSQEIELSLGHRSVTVTMDKTIANAVSHSPDSVAVDSSVNFEFTESGEFLVRHQYTFSVDNISNTFEFVDSAKTESKEIEKEIAQLLIPKDNL